MNKWGINKQLAFVLGGGGSRGALQVGAMRALLEAGYQPDLVTGTSIGAANGAFLAVNGFTSEGIAKLEKVWRDTVNQDLLPTNLWRQTMQVFMGRSKGHPQQRIREFAISNGLTPDLRFKDLQPVKLFPVAADLNSGNAVVFGADPEGLVLDSIFASMALPPWITPAKMDGRLLMDGGAVSNLPIEAALKQGATEMIALDLLDPSEPDTSLPGIGDFLLKLDKTVEYRQEHLEMELAAARGVPVKHIILTVEKPVPLWDFRYSVELIDRGYKLTQQAIAAWKTEDDQSSLIHKLGLENVIKGFLKTFKQ
jgi:NTE family protein